MLGYPNLHHPSLRRHLRQVRCGRRVLLMHVVPATLFPWDLAHWHEVVAYYLKDGQHLFLRMSTMGRASRCVASSAAIWCTDQPQPGQMRSMINFGLRQRRCSSLSICLRSVVDATQQFAWLLRHNLMPQARGTVMRLQIRCAQTSRLWKPTSRRSSRGCIHMPALRATDPVTSTGVRRVGASSMQIASMVMAPAISTLAAPLTWPQALARPDA